MDTITLRLSREDAGNIDLLEHVPCYLSNVVEHRFENGSFALSGIIKNLKVSVNVDSLIIKNGSLTKWALGDNLKNMTRKMVQNAIEDLSDTVHLPINKANITRLDYGKNLLMQHEPRLYYPYLGNIGRYERLEMPKGLYYTINAKQLCFYDKVQEIKKAGGQLPELYQNKNILRFEKRYLSGLGKIFNMQNVPAYLLYDETFYKRLNDDWLRSYQQIDKQIKFKINMDNIETKEQYKRVALVEFIQMQGGKLAALENIQERLKRGLLTKKQAYDQRQLINDCFEKIAGTVGQNELIQELDVKMKNAIAYYR